MKALIYNPDGRHRAALEQVLGERGYRCQSCTEPEAAWTAFGRETPSLVFVDATAGEAGLELCRRLDTHRTPGATEIIGLVAGEPRERIEELLAAGADDFLLVPVDRQHLDVRRLLAERRLQRQRQELSGRQRVEESLRASKDRFRCLVRNASDLISILDGAGRILYLSPASTRITGYQADHQVGESAFDLVHPQDRDALRRKFQELVATPGGSCQIEYRLQHRDGGLRVLEAVMANRLDDPAVRGVVVNTRDVTGHKEAEERRQHDALHDALTGLPNRSLFVDRLGHALDRSKRGGPKPCAVLFVDLDRFKMVNDSLGHAQGDLLLIEAGKRLAGCLRPTDTLARLGGDEFAVLLEDVRAASDPVRVARRILKVLAEPYQLSGREVYVTASIGIAISQTAADSRSELLRSADTAMYRAKEQGRADFAVFDPEMHARVLHQLQVETALRRAVEQWQFEIFYQPIVTLETGVVAGVEALLRWHHPERGLVMPEEFIPLAEETGLINPIGKEVLRLACHQMKDWQDRLRSRPTWFLTVNLSSRQFAQPDLVDQIAAALDQSGLPPSCLVLELTENLIIDHPETGLATLEALKDLKIRLALDDFGTGHSSLSVLHRFPLDKVKLDHWLVHNLNVDRGSEELVEGVLALCHWRRLGTVAEGVETEEQRQKLCLLGCNYAQGFLFAPPSEARKVEAYLKKETLIW